MKITMSLISLAFLVGFAPSISLNAQDQNTYVYKPKSQELYAAIAHMDSVYFNAYNNCDMATQATIFADTIEFYHDQGGLETSKTTLLDAIKKNICGKVTRVLVPGSIEVYPIPGYGAVEMALHRFINHAENDHISMPSRLVAIWRNRDGKWQMTRIVSLHAGN